MFVAVYNVHLQSAFQERLKPLFSPLLSLMKRTVAVVRGIVNVAGAVLPQNGPITEIRFRNDQDEDFLSIATLCKGILVHVYYRC